MALIMLIDTMADRYKMLPSEVMNRASTFDIYVMDAALSYQNYQRKKQDGKLAQDLSTDEMQEMMRKARGG